MGIVELVSPTAQGTRWERHWDDLGMDVTDFSFEASSDLLILMERKEDEYVLCKRGYYFPDDYPLAIAPRE
jgi:hypothetical protein